MKHRYSFLIIPIQLLIGCLSIFVILYFVSDPEFYNPSFIIYIISFWVLSSFLTTYYKVLRFTKLLRILTLTFRHFFIFILGFFAFFGIFKEGSVINNQFSILISILISTFFLKLVSFLLLRWYRNLGRNYRKVIVIGIDDTSKKITNLFNNNKSLGYRYLGLFTNKNLNNKLGNVEDSFDYILDNSVDEIYCSLKELSSQMVNKITSFANSNNINFHILGINQDKPRWNYDFYKEMMICKMSLNLSRGKPLKYATSNRLASYVGNGILTFIDEKTCYSDFFTNKELVTYSNYDDLIENNLKRIKLLEQAAQNIYKEWFVNLRFPGHENTPINEKTGLPEGWEYGVVSDLCEVKSGYAFKSKQWKKEGNPVIKIKNINSVLKSIKNFINNF